jgi:hypothetical protein
MTAQDEIEVPVFVPVDGARADTEYVLVFAIRYAGPFLCVVVPILS